jgi:hypothetical protein
VVTTVATEEAGGKEGFGQRKVRSFVSRRSGIRKKMKQGKKSEGENVKQTRLLECRWDDQAMRDGLLMWKSLEHVGPLIETRSACLRQQGKCIATLHSRLDQATQPYANHRACRDGSTVEIPVQSSAVFIHYFTPRPSRPFGMVTATPSLD